MDGETSTGPDNGRALLEQGSRQYEAGLLQAATASFRAGLEVLDAGNRDHDLIRSAAYRNLGSISAFAGDFREAVSCFIRSLEAAEPTGLTDAGLAAFKDCKNLKNLHLGTTTVTDAGMVHFKACVNLERLNLVGTQVGDVGVAHFKNCKNLVHLDLAHTQVTDAGMTWLEPLKALKKVWVFESKVTEAGAKQLMAANPGVAVVLGASEPPAPMAPKPPVKKP